MVAFIVSLLFISVLASGVVAAFALPQLRAGARVFTDRGDRLARRAGRPLQPLRDAVWPRVQAVWRPVAHVVGVVTRPAAKPLVEAVRPRVAPLAQAISRAVEEGSTPSLPRAAGASSARTAVRVDGESADPSPRVARQDGVEALRLRLPLAAAVKRPAA